MPSTRFKRGARIKVSAPSERTVTGRVYASKLEAKRAAELKLLVASGYTVIVQPLVIFGEDFSYRPDFFVVDHGQGGVWYCDVKGYETQAFKKTRKLWQKYGPENLHILTRKGSKGWNLEILQGASDLSLRRCL